MFVIDDTRLESGGSFEIVRRAGRREISHVIHDIDGTHSLIRDWPPVMSRVLYEVVSGGTGVYIPGDHGKTVTTLFQYIRRKLG